MVYKTAANVESGTFSLEFIALKISAEALQSLIFKLRMFGIPIMENAATIIFCDNESVLNN